MNKKTVILLSTTMMSIAAAACAFCVSQTANAAEASTPTISGVSTAKVTTPPPIENTSSQETNSSETNGIKSSDPSDSSDKDNIKPETNSKPNSNTKTESKLEAKSDVKSDAKLDTNTNVSTVVETTAKSNADSVVNTDTKAESNIDSKPKGNEAPVSTTIFNQALFASGKPSPNQTPKPQTQTTELRVSLCWETMNGDNNNALVKADSDFGQLNFVNWDFGSTLDSSRQDVKNAFAKIEFKIIDTTDNNKVVATTAGTYDPNTATSATKSLGSYDSSHTYEVSVVNSTIPSPYYVTYNNVSAGEGDEFTPSVSNFTWTPANASNKAYQNKYFRLNALEIVYAKDESVAAKCFSYEQPKKDNGDYRSDGNWKFQYNDDNIFKRIRVKDNAIQFPKDNNGNLIHPVKAGFKFDGWQFYVARKTNGIAYTSYDRMSDDDKTIINSTTVAYVPFNAQTITYPYLFAVIRDSKGVNTFGSKLGTQYCSTNHTFVVFPKWVAAGHTVTFMNGETRYAQVKVQENKSIDSDEWTTESMPANPSKDGFTFEGWNEKQDGSGAVFSASTRVSSDLTVYSIFKDYPPVITVQNKTITEGDSLDLNSLVVSAKDREDGDITSKVKLTNNGGFDNTKVGSYNITFSVTDNGGETATAAATVTVTKKPTPPTPPTPMPTPEPEPNPVPVPELPVPVSPAPILTPAEAEPEPAPAPALSQPEQPEQPEDKRVVKHLPKTGSATTPILASAIASLFAGFAGLAESFAANRKRRNYL
ncbi:InlB B-repeat-containing protein [Gardnerella vaginalis]|uniref:InlB B-repeat-containing protein n=1 Tax=Gardnerella vaginalis TaxID=2702 RepID=UPI001FF4DEAD|nr:InlB B-repeat-containing protein [Gardnerella vaginalis]